MGQPLRGLQDLSNISAGSAVVACLCPDGCEGMSITKRGGLVLRLVHLLVNVHPARYRLTSVMVPVVVSAL